MKYTPVLELAAKFDIKHASVIIDEVQSAIACWNRFAEKAGVSRLSMKQIGEIIS